MEGGRVGRLRIIHTNPSFSSAPPLLPGSPPRIPSPLTPASHTTSPLLHTCLPHEVYVLAELVQLLRHHSGAGLGDEQAADAHREAAVGAEHRTQRRVGLRICVRGESRELQQEGRQRAAA